MILYFHKALCPQFAWLPLFTEGKLSQLRHDPFHHDLPVYRSRLQLVKCLQETGILSGPGIEGEDIDVFKKIIVPKRILYLHEQRSDSIMARADGLLDRPVLQ